MSPSKLQPDPIGGADRDRTDDLLNANQALFQLSYGPALQVFFSPNRQFARTKGNEEHSDLRVLQKLFCVI